MSTNNNTILLWQLLSLLLLTTAITATMQTVKFHKINGRICHRSQFRQQHNLAVKVTSMTCGSVCRLNATCRGFRLLAAGCETFHYDRCSHQVNEDACSTFGEVFVRETPGLAGGARCAASFGSSRLGSSYKFIPSSSSWHAVNASCDSELGLSKFADIGDSGELLHLYASKGGQSTFVGVKGSSQNKATWFWQACNIQIDPALFCGTDPYPNLYFGNLWGTHTSACVDSIREDNVNVVQGVCECIDPFV